MQGCYSALHSRWVCAWSRAGLLNHPIHPTLDDVVLCVTPAASGVAERRLAWLQEGKIPKLEAILAESESEEEPDAVIELPANKIKLMVGAGGERIKLIQRKSKCRIQARPRAASGVTQCADGMTRKISAGR